ncbi:MAG: class I SAM-dependent methyltransferase, partial [Patescibacteria group bacterium]|nr:class I SAM-dependent methyltransferase [Patescibacteria group bacterium]
MISDPEQQDTTKTTTEQSSIKPREFFNEEYFEGNDIRPSNYLGGYSEFGYGKGNFYKHELEVIGKYFPQGGRIIEIGAATGTFGHAVRNKWPDGRFQYFGTDISEYALPQSKGEQTAGLAYVNIEEKSLPFKDESANIVTAFDVLEHSNPDKATIEENVREIGRILKNDGIALVTLPLQGTWFKKILGVFGIHEADPSHVQVPTKHQVEQLIRQIDDQFACEEVRYFFPLPKSKISGIPSNVLLVL